MDAKMIAVMAFFWLMTLTVGGLVLLIPISKRLGLFLESKMTDKARLPEATLNELRRLSATVEGLELQVRSVADRQEFLEKIIENRSALPAGSENPE